MKDKVGIDEGILRASYCHSILKGTNLGVAGELLDGKGHTQAPYTEVYRVSLTALGKIRLDTKSGLAQGALHHVCQHSWLLPWL